MISVVTPGYNEAESLPELYKELKDVSLEFNQPFELIFVDDGSTDNTEEVVSAIKDSRFE